MQRPLDVVYQLMSYLGTRRQENGPRVHSCSARISFPQNNVKNHFTFLFNPLQSFFSHIKYDKKSSTWPAKLFMMESLHLSDLTSFHFLDCLLCSSPLTFILFHEHIKPIPSSGALHSLFSLPRRFSPGYLHSLLLISIWASD